MDPADGHVVNAVGIQQPDRRVVSRHMGRVGVIIFAVRGMHAHARPARKSGAEQNQQQKHHIIFPEHNRYSLSLIFAGDHRPPYPTGTYHYCQPFYPLSNRRRKNPPFFHPSFAPFPSFSHPSALFFGAFPPFLRPAAQPEHPAQLPGQSEQPPPRCRTIQTIAPIRHTPTAQSAMMLGKSMVFLP